MKSLLVLWACALKYWTRSQPDSAKKHVLGYKRTGYDGFHQQEKLPLSPLILRFPLCLWFQGLLLYRNVKPRSAPEILICAYWVGRQWKATSGSVDIVCWMWAKKSSSLRVSRIEGATILPVATATLAIRHCVPWRIYSNSWRSTAPGRIGSRFRSKACIPVSSSVHTTWTPVL